MADMTQGSGGGPRDRESGALDAGWDDVLADGEDAPKSPLANETPEAGEDGSVDVEGADLDVPSEDTTADANAARSDERATSEPRAADDNEPPGATDARDNDTDDSDTDDSDAGDSGAGDSGTDDSDTDDRGADDDAPPDDAPPEVTEAGADASLADEPPEDETPEAALVRKTREAQARKEMDWLMTVSPEASGFGKVIDPDAEVSPAARSGAHAIGELDEVADPLAKTRPDIVPPRRSAASESIAKGAVDNDARAESIQAPATAEPEAPGSKKSTRFDKVSNARVAANEPPSGGSDKAAPGGNSRGVLIGVVAVASAAALYFGFLRGPGGDAKHTEAKPTVAVSANPEARPTKPSADPTTHTDIQPIVDPVEPTTSKPDEELPPKRVVVDPSVSADPRVPPPGTPPEIATVFRKLPVSPSDGPPVGGVGETGIHIDDITMGVTYENRKCGGASQRFSLSADHRPSVCVRVVHPREKEDLVVVWEKKGGASRRGKLHIKAAHAYRTRAYLMLRREYIGDWTVRIQSPGGVELASHDFSVVE